MNSHACVSNNFTLATLKTIALNVYKPHSLLGTSPSRFAISISLVLYFVYMLISLYVLIMCLHPKLDVNFGTNDTQTDWDIDDNCDYIYNIDHVQSDDFVVIQTNV